MSIIQNLAKLATKVSSSGTISYADLGNKPEVLKVTSISYPGDDLAADPAGGQTITLTGSGFAAGAQVLVDTTPASVVTVVSSTAITFTAPAKSAGTYVLYIVNTDGSVALSLPGISYSGTPAWSTSAGTLGTQYETTAVSKSLVATGDGTITYSLLSGTLPPGSTLNSATGALSGTAPAVGGSTTYNFTIRATDAQNQDTDRAFSITISPDIVTWSSPIDNYSVTADVGAATSLALSASAATGNSISYSADALPTGLSISGSNITGTPSVIGTTISTVTATAATTNKTSTRTINWTISIASESYFKYVSLLINGNGTNATNNNVFLDSSINNNTITASGNSSQGSFSPYGSTWSGYFDGSAYTTWSGLSLSGDYTIECWFYQTAKNTNYVPLISGTTGSYNFPLALDYSAGSQSDGYIGAYSIGGVAITSTSRVFSLNTWNHVAAVRSGSTVKIYLNGVQVATGTDTSTVFINTIGGWSGGSNFSFYGYISNVRITNTAVYNSTFTPNTSPLTAISGTQLLTLQSNRFIDNSSYSFNLANTGSPSIQRFNPFGATTSYSTTTIGGSAYFDGAGDYLSTPATNHDLGSGNFTIETWIYPQAEGGKYFINYNGSTGSYGQVAMAVYGTAKIEVDISSSSNTWAIVYSSPNNSITLNAWNHVALVRNGSTFTLYLNGVGYTAGTLSGTLYNYNNSTYIGYNGNASYVFKGYLADTRIVKGTAVYTSNFTPPTTPLTPVSNTQLLLNYTNAAIYDSSMNNNLETIGTVQVNTAIKKYGSGSIYFNSSTSTYIDVSNTNSFALPGDFTIELWAYPTSTSGTQEWVSKEYGVQIYLLNGYWGVAVSSSNNSTYFINDTSKQAIANTWQHLCLIRSGDAYYFYVDGVFVVKTASTAAPALGTTSPIRLGNFSGGLGSYGSLGYIDDLRISKCVRYIAGSLNTITSSRRNDSGLISALYSSGSWYMMGNTSAGNYIKITFDNPVVVSSATYKNVGGDWAPTSVLIQYSSDDVTWNTAQTYLDNNTATLQTISVPGGASAKYWRMYQNSNTRMNSAGYEWHIINFSMQVSTFPTPDKQLYSR